MGHVIHVHQVLHLAALEQVFGHDFIHVLHLDPAVEGALGVDNDHGAGFAQAEAARPDYLNLFFQSLFLQLLLKALDQLMGAGRRAARTTADQYMCAIKIHGYSSSFVDYLSASACSFASCASAAPMVYSSTGRPLTMCSATMRGTISGLTWT